MIKLKNVSKYYKSESGVSEGMRGVSTSFELNEFVAITGESGSGKTTLLNVISGLDSYEDGEVFVGGKETSHYTIKEWEEYRAQYIGFIFQNYNVIDSYTVYQNVVIALEAQGLKAHNKKERALELIEKVGLTSHKNQRTSKLSGGQKQRVVIARALAKDAPIILADEPTGNLDAESGDQIMKLLKEISEDKLVILVTHNYNEAANYVTRKVVMHDGNIKSDEQITPYVKSDKKLSEDFDNSNIGSLKVAAKIGARNLAATPKRSIFSIALGIVAISVFLLFYAALIKNATVNMGGETGDRNEIYVQLRENETAFNNTSASEFIGSYENKYLDIAPTLPTNINATITSSFGGSIFYNIFNSSRLSNSDLEEGRMPEAKNEILIQEFWNETEYEVGDELVVNFTEPYTTNITYTKTYKVTGIPKEEVYFGNGLYFYERELYSENYLLNTDIYGSAEIYELTIGAKDRQELNLLKDRVNTDKYIILDPFLVFEQELGFVTNTILLIFWVILIVILSVVFFVTYNVQKNIMKSRKKDFAVYRSIGINEQEVGIMILFEQLLLALIAITITFVALIGLSLASELIRDLTRHLIFRDYLLVGIVFTVFSVLQGLKFNRKIFNITVIDSLKEGV